ncbi:hypothetical protein FXN63_14980 [Pigmentiphaga aceris]|uniref:Cyclase dehydrase n=2 Tax=Pigmentiphaga aceris TaxID=1940612 RepID=A0A5C0B5X9_9BURK|nr:hypothetical protein FXN63_14980 [Pigmentiphaga aceris]
MHTRDSQHRSTNRPRNPPPATTKIARGLGWFSIALGVAEIVMPRTVARLCGMQENERLVQAYGLREIAVGIGILCARDPRPWLWARVAGDALDAGTLVTQVDSRDKQAVQRGDVALASVAAITALDVYTAQTWKPLSVDQQSAYDYSGRVGMPQSPDRMRGLARRDFKVPRDMRTPEALRPWPTAPQPGSTQPDAGPLTIA